MFETVKRLAGRLLCCTDPEQPTLAHVEDRPRRQSLGQRASLHEIAGPVRRSSSESSRPEQAAGSNVFRARLAPPGSAVSGSSQPDDQRKKLTPEERELNSKNLALEERFSMAQKKPQTYRDFSARFLVEDIGVDYIDKMSDTKLKQLFFILGAPEDKLEYAALTDNWKMFRRIYNKGNAGKEDDPGDSPEECRRMQKNAEEIILADPALFIKNMLKPPGTHTDYIVIPELNILRGQFNTLNNKLKNTPDIADTARVGDVRRGSETQIHDYLINTTQPSKDRLTNQLESTRKEYQARLSLIQNASNHTKIPENVLSKISTLGESLLKPAINRFIETFGEPSSPTHLEKLQEDKDWKLIMVDLGFKPPSALNENDLKSKCEDFVSLHGALTTSAIAQSPEHFMFYMLEDVLDDIARQTAAKEQKTPQIKKSSSALVAFRDRPRTRSLIPYDTMSNPPNYWPDPPLETIAGLAAQSSSGQIQNMLLETYPYTTATPPGPSNQPPNS